MKNQDFKKGTWSPEEDALLRNCVKIYGEGNWKLLSEMSGLNRCRKSCRLRWVNYLDPNISLEKFTDDEIELIIKMHRLLGSRWSQISRRLPGRTANAIKNYFNTRLRKMLESQPKEEGPNVTERHNVTRLLPRCPTATIVTGDPLNLSENGNHQLHRWNTYLKKTLESEPLEEEEEEPERHQVVRPIPRYPTIVIGTGGPRIVPENQHHQLHCEPPAEQNEDSVIENTVHTIWWNGDDTFKFQGNSVLPNAGEPSTYAGIGVEGKDTAMFRDRNTEWGKFLNLSFSA